MGDLARRSNAFGHRGPRRVVTCDAHVGSAIGMAGKQHVEQTVARLGRSARCRVFVESEWARLREVIVGRPFLRISRPFPRCLRSRLGEETWSLIKAREGDLLAVAFPQLQARIYGQMRDAARVLRRHGIVVLEVPQFEPEEDTDHRYGSLGAFQYFARDPLLVVGDRVIELVARGSDQCRELLPIRRLLDSVLAGRGARRIAMAPASSKAGHALRAPLLEGGDCLQTPDEVFVGISGRGSNRRASSGCVGRCGESAK